MNEGIHLDLDTWIVPGQIRKERSVMQYGNVRSVMQYGNVRSVMQSVMFFCAI